jgi:hypothetical protein
VWGSSIPRVDKKTEREGEREKSGEEGGREREGKTERGVDWLK